MSQDWLKNCNRGVSTTMRIAIGSDHAGFNLKKRVIEHFAAKGLKFVDYGVDGPDSADYPDIGAPVAEAVASGREDLGILICGTGIGMTIVANKVPGIRAALCHDAFTARAAREHNDANILTMGERVTDPELALEIVATWLGSSFQGGRHARRLEKISRLEEKYLKRV